MSFVAEVTSPDREFQNTVKVREERDSAVVFKLGQPLANMVHLVAAWEYRKIEVGVDVEAVEAGHRRGGLGKRDIDCVLSEVDDHLFHDHESSSDDAGGVILRLVFNEERYAKLNWTL